MKYKISIIIPVYNAEKYLKECVESIMNQTIGFENIQIILVDDGSKDDSKLIIHNLYRRYENIEAIFLEQSHSLGGFARNEGIRRAQGQYLMFLDSDDCLDKEACRLMYETITR